MRVQIRVYFAVYSDMLSPKELQSRIRTPASSTMRKAAGRSLGG